MTRLIPKKSKIQLILLFSLILNAVGIWFGLPSHEGWAPDEILPDHVRHGIEHRFAHGWHAKYPPLHYYLLALVQGPFMVGAKFLRLDLDDVSIHSVLILLGRLLSVIMGAGIVFLVYKCGQEIYDQRSSLFAAMITALLVPFVYYAKTANLDVSCLFWFTVSMFFFLRLMKTRQRKYYLLFALSAVFAVCTKDQAYALYIFPLLTVLFLDWKSRKKATPNLTPLRFLSNPTYLYAAAVALVAFFLIYNLGFNVQGFLLHLKEITGPLSIDARLFPHTLAGHISLLGRALNQIRFSLGWPLFAVCVAGVIRALVSKPRNVLLLSLLSFAISYEILLIHVIMYNYARFYLPVCVILSLFGGGFLGAALGAHPRFSKLLQVAVIAVYAYSVLYASSLDVIMVKDSRYAAEKWMKENIAKDATIGLGVWPVYAPRLTGFRRFRMENPFMSLSRLPSKPDYILLTLDFTQRFLPPTGRKQIFRRFYLEQEKYKIIYRYKTPLLWLPLRHREVEQQINSINPEILILKKREICFPSLSSGIVIQSRWKTGEFREPGEFHQAVE